MMKKFRVIPLFLALLTLASCGGGTVTPDDGTKSTDVGGSDSEVPSQTAVFNLESSGIEIKNYFSGGGQVVSKNSSGDLEIAMNSERNVELATKAIEIIIDKERDPDGRAVRRAERRKLVGGDLVVLERRCALPFVGA